MDSKRIWFAVWVGLLVVAVLSLPVSGAADRGVTVYVVEIDDETIDSGTAHYIGNAVTRAEREDAVLVIKMDTPGGLLQPTKKIVDRILNSETRVVCWVTPEGAYAYSAGTYILLSSNVAAMDRGTSIGAAAPRPYDNKTAQAMVSWIEEIAKAQGRAGGVAKNFVTENRAVGSEVAREENLIDLKAENMEKISNFLGISQFHTVKLEKTFSSHLFSALSTPTIAILLLIAGMLGIVAEITTGGVGVPGIAGGICLLLAFLGLRVLAINEVGLLLSIVGVVLLAVEALHPGFGAFGIGGGVMLFLGVVFIGEEPWMEISGTWVKIVAVCLIVVFAVFVWVVRRVQKKEVKTGMESMVGKKGEVTETIDPDGVVHVRGERWSATSDEKIEKGEEIIVTKVTEKKGLTTLVVKKLSEN